MIVRLTHIDGKLPNLALMRLAHWHRARGDEVHFTKSLALGLFEPSYYDRIYGSVLFSFSSARVERFRRAFPDAIIGGSGSADPDAKIEDIAPGSSSLDYSLYPDFEASLGYTQRGCRMKCKFCGVPRWEGKPVSVATIADIWRGPGHPKNLHLLDNDFFGVAESVWKACLAEIRAGGFKVCFNQGINVRLITEEIATELASVEYRDDGFTVRRLYTAWDNLKDEAVFFRGVERLERAGIPPSHLMAYMLVGFDQAETEERMFHRFYRMVDRGIRPYPMVWDRGRRDLTAFQRWAITGLYRSVPWSEYRHYLRRRPPPAGQAELGL